MAMVGSTTLADQLSSVSIPKEENVKQLLTYLSAMLLLATLNAFAQSPELHAPYSQTTPTINGVIDPTEWQNARSYDLTFIHNPDLTTQSMPVWLLNDSIYLYVAAKAPFPSDPYFWYGLFFDGDHSHTLKGSFSEPHITVDYNKAGTTTPAYPFYDEYRIIQAGCATYSVTPPSGAQHGFSVSGTNELSFEFKVPLSDLTVQPGGTAGFAIVLGVNSTSGNNWSYPSLTLCSDLSQWAHLVIETVLCGDVNCSGGDPAVDIDDVVCLIDYVFASGSCPCALLAGDANCSGGDPAVDIDDIVYLINYIFAGGPAPCADCDGGTPVLKSSMGSATLSLLGNGTNDRNVTTLAFSSDQETQGLQLEFETSGDVLNLTASSTLNGIQVFSGWVDGRFKVGLLDMQGQAMIPAGKSDILTLSYSGDGEIELVKTIAVAKGGGRLDVTITKGASETTLPRDFSLEQNHPNPFNPSTEISFSLPVTSQVRLDVFNIMGQKVTTLVKGSLPAGKHTVVWDGKSLAGETVASGVYFYKIEAAGFTDVKKMLLMK
jgi:hypothetical protein